MDSALSAPNRPLKPADNNVKKKKLERDADCMRFSLIVVTTDRLHLIKRFFVSLTTQTHKNFEVIFVHGKECMMAARSLAASYADSLDIKIVTSPDYCLSRSRNTALPLVSGDIIAFPDDDCTYEPNTLAQCAAAFVEIPQAQTLAGCMCDMDEPILPQTTVPRELNWMSVFHHSISFIQFHRRVCVEAVGGFDEGLGVGCPTPYQSGEDTDYMLRALNHGFRAFHAPLICVRHPAVNVQNMALLEKTKNYARGRMRLLRKHGMPRWFIMANILYPLFRIPPECIKKIHEECLAIVRYRWTMFKERLKGQMGKF